MELVSLTWQDWSSLAWRCCRCLTHCPAGWWTNCTKWSAAGGKPHEVCWRLCEAEVRPPLKSDRRWQTKAKELVTAEGFEHLPRQPLQIAETDPPWLSAAAQFHLAASEVSRTAPAEARCEATKRTLDRHPALKACAWNDGNVDEGARWPEP